MNLLVDTKNRIARHLLYRPNSRVLGRLHLAVSYTQTFGANMNNLLKYIVVCLAPVADCIQAGRVKFVSDEIVAEAVVISIKPDIFLKIIPQLVLAVRPN